MPLRSTALQQALLTIGPILVVIGAIAYSISALTAYSGWMVSFGGLLGAIGTLLSSFVGKEASARVRRLDRMGFLAMLMFIVSGGFMIQGSSSWLAIFAVGTVFFHLLGDLPEVRVKRGIQIAGLEVAGLHPHAGEVELQRNRDRLDR